MLSTEDIEQLHARVNPPRPEPKSVVNSVFQMGMAIGGILRPLRDRPTRTPGEEANAQQALRLPGIAHLVLLTAGLLGGILWHIFSGGELAIDLAAGVGFSMVGALTLMMLGLVMGAFVKVMASMMRTERPTDTPAGAYSSGSTARAT